MSVEANVISTLRQGAGDSSAVADPVPAYLLPEFVKSMRAHDVPDVEPGIWLEGLTTGAGQFMQKHQLRGRAVEAVGQYIDVKRALGATQPEPVRVF